MFVAIFFALYFSTLAPTLGSTSSRNMLGLELLNETGDLPLYLLAYEGVLVSAPIIFMIQILLSSDDPLSWQIINCMDEYADGIFRPIRLSRRNYAGAFHSMMLRAPELENDSDLMARLALMKSIIDGTHQSSIPSNR